MTTFAPRLAGPNWAATNPAADETEGISAMSELSAPISLATADRAAPAARSPRLKSKPTLVQSSMSSW
jgi:hypothetical protein